MDKVFKITMKKRTTILMAFFWVVSNVLFSYHMSTENNFDFNKQREYTQNVTGDVILHVNHGK